MAGLKLNHIYKVYPNGVKAVNDFCMEIEDKEFIVFVGPSGCGKSTTLRMIAGLEDISAGELYIGDTLVNNLEPVDRDIAMVFQNYALYPHMTVYNNMAFGLKMAKVPKEERDKSKIKALTKSGKPMNSLQLLFARVPKEKLDASGNPVLENGNPVYEHKTDKKGNEVKDKNGNPVILKRPYTDEERLGPVVRDENGNPVLMVKKTQNGKTVYKLRKYTKEEIDKKIHKAADILGITEYLDRKPKAMSGGQRQRVALGRALVREPKVFLLDEPLSNLDAKLRTATRTEISKLHKSLQTTFIYVTHDQVEAMTMGTRIVVMKSGCVQQIDTPKNLYRYPGNKFVAGFIGTPQMNFFEGKLLLHGDKITVTFDNTPVSLEIPAAYLVKADYNYLDGKKPVTIGIRPENVSVDASLYPFKAKCRVSQIEELGTDCQIFADLNLDSDGNAADSATKIIIKAPADSQYEYGDIIDISLDMSSIHLFDSQTEVTIAPRIPAAVKVDASVKANKLIVAGHGIALPPALNLQDGEYSVVIPTAAVKLGGELEAEATKIENIKGQRLVHLNFGGKTLFALANRDGEIGKSVKIGLDLKQLSVIKDGETIVKSIETLNAVNGKYVKTKRATDGEKTETVNLFVIGNSSIDCPAESAKRLADICGNMIYNKQLRFEFGAYGINIGKDASENGVTAAIKAVKDYGAEKFLICDADGQIINVALTEGADEYAGKEGEQIKLNIDPETISVVDVDSGIRLL